MLLGVNIQSMCVCMWTTLKTLKYTIGKGKKRCQQDFVLPVWSRKKTDIMNYIVDDWNHRHRWSDKWCRKCYKWEDLWVMGMWLCVWYNKSFLVLVQSEVQIFTQASVSLCTSSVKVFPGARQGAAGRAGGTADHLHPPGGKWWF